MGECPLVDWNSKIKIREYKVNTLSEEFKSLWEKNRVMGRYSR